jgi:hypothetical protein
MIRSALIVLMTLSAISAGLLGALSFNAPLYVGLPLTNRFLGYVYVSEGLTRFYFFQSDQDVRLSPSDDRRSMRIRRRFDDRTCQRFSHAPTNQIAHYQAYWQRSNRARSRTSTPPMPVIRMSGVRFQILVVVAALIAYPIVAVVAARGARRRRRVRASRGLCQTCAYDLTGNTSGVCPECGASI